MEHESSPTRVALTLSEDECMLHRGPLAHKGKLSLSEAALTFEPSGTLDRLAGVRPVTIPVDSITDSTSGEGNHKVQVSTESNVHHFSGRGAVRVQERLAALMAERAGTEDARFAAGEVVLVQGRATLFVNALMAVRGELTLTTQRFRFVPQLGVDQILWDPAGLDVTVDEISAFELLGVRGRLRLDIGGQSHIFGGSLASSVYTHLEILQGHDLDSSAFAVLDTWPVQLRSGPIAHPGELAIRPQQLLFSPQGTIDTLVGVRELAIDLERIDRLRVTGRIDQHLEIRTGDRSHAFYSAAPQDRMWFLAAVVRRHLEQASERGEPGVASVEETIAAWSSVLDIDPTEERLFCSPAGSIEKSNEVLFGWLVLTPTQVMFLPLCTPDAEQTGVFIAPVDSICRADREPQDQLVILTNGVGHSFLVSDSSGGADAFWANSSSPERILVWDRLSPSIDAHLHGECRYVQITAGEEVLAELEPGLLLKRDEGVGVLAPSFLARSIPVGDQGRDERGGLVGQSLETGLGLHTGTVQCLHPHPLGFGLGQWRFGALRKLLPKLLGFGQGKFLALKITQGFGLERFGFGETLQQGSQMLVCFGVPRGLAVAARQCVVAATVEFVPFAGLHVAQGLGVRQGLLGLSARRFGFVDACLLGVDGRFGLAQGALRLLARRTRGGQGVHGGVLRGLLRGDLLRDARRLLRHRLGAQVQQLGA